MYSTLKRFLKSLEEELNDESSQIWNQKSSYSCNSIPIYEAEIYSKNFLIHFIIVPNFK
jgi:hypothetical protein